MRKLHQYFITFVVLLSPLLIQAQGLVEGGPDIEGGILEQAGSQSGSGEWAWLDAALGNAGSLTNLINDFSFENLLGFGCGAATSADEVATEQNSPDAGTYGEVASTVCSIEQYYQEIQALSTNYEEIFKTWGKNLFTDFLQYDLGLGTDFSREELQGYIDQVDQIIAGDEDPDKLISVMQDVAAKKAEKNQQALANAPEGSQEYVFEQWMQQNPQIRWMNGALEIAKYNNTVTQGQSMSNLLQSGKIADTQMESDVMDTLNKNVNEVVAPLIRDEAKTAVSTRATIQEVVNALTIYMQQDVDTMTHLSKQLAMQSQQEVYTAQQLNTLVNTLLQEERNRIEEQQTALRQGANKIQTEQDKATDMFVGVGTSMVKAGDSAETDALTFTLFDF
jgi:hypothetical protein